MLKSLVLMTSFFSSLSLYRCPHRSHSAIEYLPDANFEGMISRTVDGGQNDPLLYHDPPVKQATTAVRTHL